EGGIVEGAERRHLSPPHQTGVGIEPDDRRIEPQGASSAGAGIGAVAERLFLLIGRDFLDSHDGAFPHDAGRSIPRNIYGLAQPLYPSCRQTTAGSPVAASACRSEELDRFLRPGRDVMSMFR